MIRLPTTTVILGDSDLKDFEKRGPQRRAAPEFDGRCIGTQKGPCFDHGKSTQRRPELAKVPQKEGVFPNHTTILPAKHGPSFDPPRTAPSSNKSPRPELSLSFHALEQVQSDASPESPDPQIRQPSSTTKDAGFDYGGFVESVAQDTPAPQAPETPDGSRTGSHRLPPRSPLYISQMVLTGIPTSRLTPRVESRVAMHNAPGIIFAQPPRRPLRHGIIFEESGRRRPRYAPRSFRHQTNSFSLDSSDQSSAAYEEDPVSSDSTGNLTLGQVRGVSLDQEITGCSELLSIDSEQRESRRISVLLDDPEEFKPDRQDSKSSSRQFLSEGAHEIEDLTRISRSDSPQLLLPPLSATAELSVISSEYLPRPERHIPWNPSASPSKSSASMSVTTINGLGHTSGSPPARNISSNRVLSHLISAYRSRSPLSNHGSSDHPPSSPPSPTTFPSAHTSPGSINIETPRNYRVYNDASSPTTQPQTPAHLPEARHQSRFHPSFTAPARRGPGIGTINNYDGAGLELRERLIQSLSGTPSRRGTGRPDSPVEMLAHGFYGLYGGRENGDDERSWAEGIRHDNTEVRLWGLRDARNNGRSLNETPEREDWRAGLRYS